MYDYDDDRPTVEVCGSALRRTRRPRTCETCGETIPVGQVYERRLYKVDGDVGASAFHPGH